MSTWGRVELPGKPSKALRDIWAGMTSARREAFYPHLMGDTSADYLAAWLDRAGTPFSATSIRTYRRTLPDRTPA